MPIPLLPMMDANHGAEFHLDARLRERLLNALQYGDAAAERSNTDNNQLDPYLEYICTRLMRSSADGKPHLGNLVELFITAVEYFGHQERINHTVGKYLRTQEDHLRSIFSLDDSDEFAKARWRRERINDVVSSIALWIMEEDFHERFENQSIRAVFFSRVKAGFIGYSNLALNDNQLDHDGNFTIWSIADVLGLLPTLESWVEAPSADPHEEVFQSRLNARLINRIGQVRFRWTFNCSEHMQLRNNELYLFCMPSRHLLEPKLVENDTPDAALDSLGFRRERGEEILKSYYLLFGPQNKQLLKDLLASPHLSSPHDSVLKEYCEENAAGRAAESLARWSKQEFKYLWPSIKYLEHFLRDIEPDKLIKLIYRDRRNSYAWWTFLLAFIVVILTLISTVFTVIQGLKAFFPSGGATSVVIVTMNAQPAATGTTTPTSTVFSTRSSTAAASSTTTAAPTLLSTAVFELESSCFDVYTTFCVPFYSEASNCANIYTGNSTNLSRYSAMSSCYCTDSSMLSLASRCEYDFGKSCVGDIQSLGNVEWNWTDPFPGICCCNDHFNANSICTIFDKLLVLFLLPEFRNNSGYCRSSSGWCIRARGGHLDHY
ncbi:hypothetical protein PV08_09576 [Exophiala spinifera]|uniref:Uncharacterized protein n=1 Tax=Exophiala spinifera TaxID=91928 RepID=A0A0D2BM78_9EURO|nr:uncharacterized protein PV08_09576 [Exophiala spinifera]KIW12299.1 hypothetical protein PV08_09576 [Exophiala spinifera]